MNREHFAVNVRVLLSLYKGAFRGAAQAFVVNYWAILLPLLYAALALYVLVPLSRLFGGMAQGFFLGIAEILIWSHFLCVLAASHRLERLGFKDSLSEARDYIYGTISVVFAIFLVQLVEMIVFKRGLNIYGLGLRELLILVLNVLPEVVVFSRRMLTGWFSAFEEAWGFISHNWLEWFMIPAAILLIAWVFVPYPLSVYTEQAVLSGYTQLFSLNVFFFPFAYILSFSSPFLALWGLFLVVMSYFFMLFRFSLYEQLNSSSRRKRVYQHKMQS